MENKWFLFNESQVIGPLSTAEAQSHHGLENSLIWGTGLREWIKPKQWTLWLEKLEVTQRQAQPPPPARTWRIRLVDQDHGPLLYHEMLDLLKGRNNYEDIWVWTEGYKEWQNVFGFHKLMDDLGLGRRLHPRVSIKGHVEIKKGEATTQARIMSISEGGIGLAAFEGLHVGDNVGLVIRSEQLATTLIARAEVVYLENTAYAGLKFTHLSSEARNKIVEYVIKHLQDPNAKPS